MNNRMLPIQRPSRRAFLQMSAAAAASLAIPTPELFAAEAPALNLPVGNAPQPVPFPHFPSRLHAFVWRNWTLVPLERIARTVNGLPKDIARLADSMGLPKARKVSPIQIRRSYITVIRRNWHLLPYEQLLTLLDWTAEKMEFTLREDDFLYVKLGSHKPKCAPLRFEPPSAEMLARARGIAAIVKQEFSKGLEKRDEPLFSFVKELESGAAPAKSVPSRFSPKFCYSYFALYGDPLLEREADPYPEGYLR